MFFKGFSLLFIKFKHLVPGGTCSKHWWICIRRLLSSLWWSATAYHRSFTLRLFSAPFLSPFPFPVHLLPCLEECHVLAGSGYVNRFFCFRGELLTSLIPGLRMQYTVVTSSVWLPSLPKGECPCDYNPVNFILVPYFPTNSTYYYLQCVLALLTLPAL